MEGVNSGAALTLVFGDLSLKPRAASSWTTPVRVAQIEQRRELVINQSQQPGIQQSCLLPGFCLFSSANVGNVAILTSYGKNILSAILLCSSTVQKYLVLCKIRKKMFLKVVLRITLIMLDCFIVKTTLSSNLQVSSLASFKSLEDCLFGMCFLVYFKPCFHFCFNCNI